MDAFFIFTQIINMFSIEDEFQEFKQELEKLGIQVLKIQKVGNGSMSFHEVTYKSPRYNEEKKVFVERHKLDELLSDFKKAYA
ncbi:hypothetical protein SAMN05660477_01584 [Soonwooa buanensis]|uniref:Uncharacterized protein n=1 Tax=Soonwooa buanensis TaxID=619805 RepID=A0A1T5EUK2_9FLAO|nr:hypothetical protein [Soonwooa buanensis]SKB87652.1 hypothetical protein SAMN05660477_01584 [Soonwooa buanensis]